jgi:hypothetical protein
MIYEYIFPNIGKYLRNSQRWILLLKLFLVTRLHMLPRSGLTELYLNSLIRLYGMVLKHKKQVYLHVVIFFICLWVHNSSPLYYIELREFPLLLQEIN